MHCTRRTWAFSTYKRRRLSSERCPHVKFPLKTIENTGFRRNDCISNWSVLIVCFRRNRYVYICLNSALIVFQHLTGLNSVRYICIHQIPDRKPSILALHSKRAWTITTQSCDKKKNPSILHSGRSVISSPIHHYYRWSPDH